MPGRVPVAWLVAALVVVLSSAEARAAEAIPDLFPRFAAARVDHRLPLPQWDGIIAALRRDDARIEACRVDRRCDDRPARRVVDLVDRLTASGRHGQLAAVHDFVNAVPYVTDAAKFGVEDHWQSPLDFLDGSGDCEDYVIAKYFVLRQLGWADADHRIVIYIDRSTQVIHAILAATMDRRAAILDNRSPRVGSPADYPAATPKYALNVGHRWVFVNLANQPAGGEATAEIRMDSEATPGDGEDGGWRR
jgi:predicted transglutaminase-like cysteine proteinase